MNAECLFLPLGERHGQDEERAHEVDRGGSPDPHLVEAMGVEKKDELDKVVIKNDTLRKYFPRSYTPKQMEDTIIKLLEQWQRKQQRQNER